MCHYGRLWSVDDQFTDILSVDNLSVNDISVDDLSVDDLSVDDLSVDDISVDDSPDVCNLAHLLSTFSVT